jgi:uncharacterized protein RhaS with RHS repeats
MSYDNNGNLLTGDNFTNTWDYRNRLTQTQLNGTTASYLYDVNDERIALGANGATTTYPFKLYNVQGNTITKHIFANGEPVADVQGSTTTAAVYYIHDDHLGGSSVISDARPSRTRLGRYLLAQSAVWRRRQYRPIDNEVAAHLRIKIDLSLSDK